MKLLSSALVAIFLLVVSCGRDFYAILNVPRTATRNEIKKAYRLLAKTKHPDQNRDDPNAESSFRDISDAHEVLSNEEKRKIYDKYGEDGLKQQGGMSEDFFDAFGFRRQPTETPRGDDVHMDLWVTLEELYVGELIEITRIKMIKKPASGTRKCNCRMELRTVMLGPGRFQMSQEQVCSECPNFTFEPLEGQLHVKIQPGMRHGYIHTFKEAGEPHEDSDSGDLNLRVFQQKHKIFHRRGDDLYTNLTISLVEALNGFNMVITHLDKHQVVLKTSQITAPGTIIRKPNEGMPNFENPQIKGSLFITVDVSFPKDRELTDEERKIVTKLFGDSKTKSMDESVQQGVEPKPAPLYNGLDRFSSPPTV